MKIVANKSRPASGAQGIDTDVGMTGLRANRENTDVLVGE
jgi:hypothetical protein